MADPGRGGPGQLSRVGAGDEKVAGVQAERDRAAVQDPADLVGLFHHGPDVRVQRRLEPALGGPGSGPVQVGQQQRPAGRVKLGPAVIAAAAGGRSQDQHRVAAGEGEGVQGPVEKGQGIRGGLVQDDRARNRPRASARTRPAAWTAGPARAAGSRRARTRWRSARRPASRPARGRRATGVPSPVPRRLPRRSVPRPLVPSSAALSRAARFGRPCHRLTIIGAPPPQAPAGSAARSPTGSRRSRAQRNANHVLMT